MMPQRVHTMRGAEGRHRHVVRPRLGGRGRGPSPMTDSGLASEGPEFDGFLYLLDKLRNLA
jgi:hypothetical protein